MTAEKRITEKQERNLTTQVILKYIISLIIFSPFEGRFRRKKVPQKCKIIRFNADRKKEAIMFSPLAQVLGWVNL